MSVLKYFKNTPGRPPIGRQALSVNFFLQIRNEVSGKKGPVARWEGDRAFFSRDLITNLKKKNYT